MTKRGLSADDGFGGDAGGAEVVVDGAVPEVVEAFGHGDFFEFVLSGDGEGFAIAGAEGVAFEEFVGGDFGVLGDEGVAEVFAGLFGAEGVEGGFEDAADGGGGGFGEGGRFAELGEAALEADDLLEGFDAVVLEDGEGVAVVGGGDHAVEHAEDVLLHGAGVLEMGDDEGLFGDHGGLL
jgi:hypothetical protein